MTGHLIYPRRRAAAALALVTVACSPHAEPEDMKTPEAATSTVTLQAQIDVDYTSNGTPAGVSIRLDLANEGDSAIAVVGVGRDGEDSAPLPTFRITHDGDLTIQRALAPSRSTQLAMPPQVFAKRMAPGSRHAAQFFARVLSAYPLTEGDETQLVVPRRVRICQGYVPFDPQGLTRIRSDADIWLTRPELIDQQTVLCSQWAGLAR